MTIKELAQVIEDLTKEEAQELVNELIARGYKMPETQVIEVESKKEEEKTSFDVKLEKAPAGTGKLKLISALKNLTGMALKEGKALIDSAPVMIKTGVSKEEAYNIKNTLEAEAEGVEILVL